MTVARNAARYGTYLAWTGWRARQRKIPLAEEFVAAAPPARR
jgi:hypothetical protein